MTPTTLEVWTRFGQRLRAFILSRVEDPADAEDILQEAFLKVHLHLNTLQDETRLVPWLYQVVRNAIVDFYRTRRPTSSIPEILADDAGPAGPDATAEIASGLTDMIQQLPEKYRQALLLTEISGLSQREMAEQLGISYSGAKSRVQRARAMLRDALFECCHLEFDRRGHIVDYVPRASCCRSCSGAVQP